MLWRATRLGVCFALVLGCSGRKPAAVEPVVVPPSAKPPPSAAAEVVEPALAKAPEPDPPAAGRDLRTLWVTGSVRDRSGRLSVDLRPLMETFGPLPSDGSLEAPAKAQPGELELRLLDATGVPIRMWPLSVVWGEETTRTGVFSTFIYEPPQFSRAAIYRDGIELTGRSSSTHPPTLEITRPVPRQLVRQGSMARWKWADRDGDPLTALVEYSSDEGASWQIYAIDYDENSMPLDVPGCKRGRLRVTVSDGFHSVTREVGPFRVPGRPPEISISSPRNDSETLSEDQSMNLEAEVFDPDEGSLEDDATRWVSNRSGELGRGRISIFWRHLAPGRHVITATATDSTGMSASASFRLDVVHAEKPRVVAEPPDEDRDLFAVFMRHVGGDFSAGTIETFEVSAMNRNRRRPATRFRLHDTVENAELIGASGEHWSCKELPPYDVDCVYDGFVSPGASSSVLSIRVRPPSRDFRAEPLRHAGYEVVNTVRFDNAEGSHHLSDRVPTIMPEADRAPQN